MGAANSKAVYLESRPAQCGRLNGSVKSAGSICARDGASEGPSPRRSLETQSSRSSSSCCRGPSSTIVELSTCNAGVLNEATGCQSNSSASCCHWCHCCRCSQQSTVCSIVGPALDSPWAAHLRPQRKQKRHRYPSLITTRRVSNPIEGVLSSFQTCQKLAASGSANQAPKVKRFCQQASHNDCNNIQPTSKSNLYDITVCQAKDEPSARDARPNCNHQDQTTFDRTNSSSLHDTTSINTDCRKQVKRLPLEPKAIAEEHLETKLEATSEQSTPSKVVQCCSKRKDSLPLGWLGIQRRHKRMAFTNDAYNRSSSSGTDELSQGQHSGQFNSSKQPRALTKRWLEQKVGRSCLCHLFRSLIGGLFPVFTAFRGYSLVHDFGADLAAGLTIGVFHIPQGMAYGLLAGVEPIYGLYVSLVPVLVMAVMSKSRHVSYGTFAVISMLMAGTIEDTRNVLIGQHQRGLLASERLAGSSESMLAHSSPLGDSSQQVINQEQQQQQWLNTLLAAATADIEPASGGAEAPTLATRPSTGSSHLELTELPSNIEILTAVCLVVGLIQVLMSLMRLGVLSLMFSDQLVSSFTCASAVHVLTSQLGPMLDLDLPAEPEGFMRICRVWWLFLMRCLDGFNMVTGIVSLLSIGFLLLVKEALEPAIRRRYRSFTCLPSELILMGVLIVCSWYLDLSGSFGVRIVGGIPTGMPQPKAPRLDLAPIVLKDSLTIALVSFAMNLSLAQVYAKRFRYKLDPNQELLALGSANLCGSFFSCFPCASSLSRSAVQSNLNPKSPLCSLISCSVVLLIILYLAPILHGLPKSTLSCIIIVALKGILIQVRDFYQNWRLSKLDALVWMLTFVSVLALGVTYGLVLGIASSLFMIFLRLLTPNHSILAQLPGTSIFVERDAFLDCRELAGIRVFRFNSPLCYLNRTMFKSAIEKAIGLHEAKRAGHRHHNDNSLERPHQIKGLVIDCSALAYCDYAGAATLADLVEELAELQVLVLLAASPLKLISMFERTNKDRLIDKHLFPTIPDAINHAKQLISNAGPKLESQLTRSLSKDDDQQVASSVVAAYLVNNHEHEFTSKQQGPQTSDTVIDTSCDTSNLAKNVSQRKLW